MGFWVWGMKLGNVISQYIASLSFVTSNGKNVVTSDGKSFKVRG